MAYNPNAWRKNKRENDPKYRMYSIKDKAVTRKIKFEKNPIKYELMTNLLNENCYYCDKKKAWGLDRIDNTKGYLLDNVLPCCGGCNVSRHTQYTVQEFKVMIQALLKFRKKNKK